MFVQAFTGSGGWPLTLLLTPQLKRIYFILNLAFFGGTYFPKNTLIRILQSVNHSWRSEPSTILHNADEILLQLKTITSENKLDENKIDIIDSARNLFNNLQTTFDEINGGFNGILFSYIFRSSKISHNSYIEISFGYLYYVQI